MAAGLGFVGIAGLSGRILAQAGYDESTTWVKILVSLRKTEKNGKVPVENFFSPCAEESP